MIQICNKTVDTGDTFPGTCPQGLGECKPGDGGFAEDILGYHVGNDVAHSLENFCYCRTDAEKFGVFCDQDLKQDFKPP